MVRIALYTDDCIANRDKLRDPLVSPRLLWVPDLTDNRRTIVVKEAQTFEARAEDDLDTYLPH